MKTSRSYSERITDLAARAANAERKANAEKIKLARAAIQPQLDALSKQADAAFAAGDETKQREISAEIDRLLASVA